MDHIFEYLTYLPIAIWVIFSVYYIYRKNKNKPIYQYVYDSIPSVFTSLGVLGTFVGIFIGLQKFDVHNINESIPPLLEGMKTAFLTSIAGIGLSLIFGKISQIVAEKTDKKYNLEEVDDEISALKSILKELQKSNSQNESHFSEIKSSDEELRKVLGNILNILQHNQESLVLANEKLTAENKNSLEIKKVLQKNSAKIEEKFNEFSVLLSKNNTEALVEVMKKVTEEFNKQMSSLINKLVQENFEELNNSVQNLNSWQKENKQMIASLTAQFTKVSEDFSISATAIKEINLNTKQLTDENSHLSKLIQKLQKVMIEDTKFEKITDKLTSTIDVLQNGTQAFNETTNKLNNWVAHQMNFTDSVAVLLAKLEEVKNVKDINEIFWKNFENQLNTSMKVIEKASNKLTQDLESINDEFYNQLDDVLKNFDNALQRIIDKKGF